MKNMNQVTIGLFVVLNFLLVQANELPQEESTVTILESSDTEIRVDQNLISLLNWNAAGPKRQCSGVFHGGPRPAEPGHCETAKSRQGRSAGQDRCPQKIAPRRVIARSGS